MWPVWVDGSFRLSGLSSGENELPVQGITTILAREEWERTLSVNESEGTTEIVGMTGILFN